MSTCILNTIARTGRRIAGEANGGGIGGACGGGDLPATQDLGTVQFSGPFESAQAVPATETIYTIIGRTSCGETIRRITTRTYSSRSLANGYRYTSSTTATTNSAGYIQPGDNVSPISIGAIVGLGVSAALAKANGMNNLWAALPASFLFRGIAHPYLNCQGTAPRTQWNGDKQLQYVATFTSSVSPFGPLICTGTYSIGNWTLTRPTIYYLDVHEVWTFDIV